MDVVRALLMKVEEIGDGAILDPTAEWVEGCSWETIIYHEGWGQSFISH